jgi:hypothetical protein
LKPVGIVVAATALVAVDAAHRKTCEIFEVGDDGSRRVAVIRVAVKCLELATFGRGARVTIGTLQANS